MPDVLYADTSALVKLTVVEAETAAVRAELSAYDVVVSSVITEVELSRAVLRVRQSGAAALDDLAVGEISAGLVLIELTPAIRRAAATLEPGTVRTLDAVHLATAAALGSDVAAILTYDRRMQNAADGLGLTVRAPR